jgi:exodeoxyribonuclease V alpha subunit
MQIKNNYDVEWVKDGYDGYGVFNGDIGTVESISPSDESVMLDFDGRETSYDYSSLDELEHAFAITVHKSQGSEYPIVLLPLGSAAPMLLTRNMLYTAVTRAQNMVIIIGNESVVRRMVDNDRHSIRYTGFCDMLV